MQQTKFDQWDTGNNGNSEKPWWKAKLDSMPSSLVIGLCIVYVISPIDLMPEAFLGPFGLGDDLIAAFVGFRAIKKALIG